MEGTGNKSVDCTIHRMVMVFKEGDTVGEEDTVGCHVEMGAAMAVCFFTHHPVSQRAVKSQPSCSYL